MPTWLLIAALATIGVTAVLVGVLYRINAPRLAEADEDGRESSKKPSETGLS